MRLQCVVSARVKWLRWWTRLTVSLVIGSHFALALIIFRLAIKWWGVLGRTINYLPKLLIVDSTGGILKRTRGKGISAKVAATVAYKQNEEPPKFTPSGKVFIGREYDYIIVGAGPAGSIIANKLFTADGKLKILVLEAGTAPPNDEIFTDPRNWTLIQENPKYEWGYASTYQDGLYGRSVPLPRSPGLGGCTIHNSLMWVRGGKLAFDNWRDEYNCAGWGWNDLVPLFTQLEKEINITKVPKPCLFVDSFIEAGKEVGYPVNSNYNSNDGIETGVSYNQYTIQNGKRINIYDLYLKNFVEDDCVHVECNKVVTKVVLSSDSQGKHNASGVECYCKNTNRIESYTAKKEVILTAGVFGSPQILMRSGIGIKKDLEEAGITCLVDSHGVGKNLVDDLFVSVTYKTKKKIPEDFTIYGIGGVIMFPPKEFIQITAQSNDMPGLYNIPDAWKQGYQIGADCHYQKSRGSMKLDPKHPCGLPIIDMNYLDKDQDLAQCIAAIKQIRKVGGAESLKDRQPEEVMPGPSVKSDEALAVYVKGTAISTMHPAGTCRMGPNKTSISNGYPAVLDSNTLKVFGCNNLRVMDNSVFPENPHGNPAAAVFAVALKGANTIINSWVK